VNHSCPVLIWCNYWYNYWCSIIWVLGYNKW